MTAQRKLQSNYSDQLRSQALVTFVVGYILLNIPRVFQVGCTFSNLPGTEDVVRASMSIGELEQNKHAHATQT